MSIRNMSHPDYVYEPWSEERRQRASLASRKRLGIPRGKARLFGIHVPIAHADDIRTDANWVRYNVGKKAAQDFIRRAQNIDWALAGELLYENATYRELAEHFGLPWWFIEKRTGQFRRISRKVVKCRNDDTGMWNESWQ